MAAVKKTVRKKKRERTIMVKRWLKWLQRFEKVDTFCCTERC